MWGVNTMEQTEMQHIFPNNRVGIGWDVRPARPKDADLADRKFVRLVTR